MPEDWLEYAEKLKEAGDVATEMHTLLLIAEREKKKCYAELIHRISEDPGRYGLKKSTDELLKQAVERHPDYDEACRKWIAARDRYGRALNLSIAWREKKTAMVEAGTNQRAGFYAQTGTGPDPFGGAYTTEDESGVESPDHPEIGEGD